MRWFIEVSSVEGGESDAQYCVDAKQWQSALQQARKLRGDAGPLSTFSIELLDNGYRAVDRKQKLRYVVKKAPNDAPLNDGKNGAQNPTAEAQAGGTAPVEPSTPPGAGKSGPAPRPRLESARPSRPTMSKPPPEAQASQEGDAAQPSPAAQAPAKDAAASQAKSEKPEESASAAPEASEAKAPAANEAKAPAASEAKAPAANEAKAPEASEAKAAAQEVKAPEAAAVPAKVEGGASAPAAASPSQAPPAANDRAARVQAIMGQSGAPRPASVPPAAPVADPAKPEVTVPSGSQAPPSIAAQSAPASEVAAIMAAAQQAERADTSGESTEDPVPLMKTRQYDATPPPADPQASPVQLKPVVTPDAEVIRARGEEPTKETPITYRELALGVKPGTSREAVEALLWERYRALTKEIESRPRGKFVQLAVFDHVFSKKPLRPPLALFLWKDWRGDPVLTFPGFKHETGHVESPSELKEKIGSLRPTSVIPIGPSTSSPPAKSSTPQASQPAAVSPSAGAQASQPAAASESVAPEASQPAAATPPDAAKSAAQSAATTSEAAAPVPADDSSKDAPSQAATDGAAKPETETDAKHEAGPAKEAAEAKPAEEKDEKPAKAKKAKGAEAAKAEEAKVDAGPKRRIGEDLIGDLFESMHELHFMADVVAGAEFLLSVLKDALPGELALIQVFDINTGKFVVVRQAGGNDAVLMHQTPDSDEFVHQAMKSPRATRVSSDGDDYFKKGRWQASGVTVKQAMSGAVRQGGRYLGLVELANPLGSDPYHESEANALDYICEQFAEFLANRPIVLDADVILRKS